MYDTIPFVATASGPPLHKIIYLAVLFPAIKIKPVTYFIYVEGLLKWPMGPDDSYIVHDTIHASTEARALGRIYWKRTILGHDGMTAYGYYSTF